MIRINLAKTQSYSAPTTQAPSGIEMPSMTGDSKAVKIASMLVFLILVIGYEKYQLNKKRSVLEGMQKEMATIQTEISKFGSVTNVIEDLIKEKEKLNGQLLVIQQISAKRAFKLKTITKIQESLPDDAWLEELKIDQTLVNLKGLARTPTSVQKIVNNLLTADFIEAANNKEMKRVKMTVDADEVQQFDIEAKVRL